MRIVLSHRTALTYWRNHQAPRRMPGESYLVPELLPADTSARINLVQDELEAIFDTRRSQAIHLLVGKESSRVRNSSISQHVLSVPIPREMLLPVAPHVMVCSPELVFVQMAEMLPFESLLMLGYELCGAYTVQQPFVKAFGDGGEAASVMDEALVPRRYLLTSPSRMKTMIASLVRVRGIRAALSAVKYVVPGTASPMESRNSLLISLPKCMGGYGLPAPTLNAEIVLSEASRKICRRSSCRGDLCWPEHKVILEYQSNEFHVGAQKLAEDSRRKSALENEGYRVLFMTWDQIKDETQYDDVMGLLGKALGQRKRTVPSDVLLRRRMLRQALFQNVGFGEPKII